MVDNHFEDILGMVSIGSQAQTHFEVRKKVRKTIQEPGGTMPKNLPLAESIKKLDKKDEEKK